MNLIERDLKHIWHPCSQMKDYEQCAPIQIKRTYGSYIELVDGTQIIDAISSWWCKSLGHQHPRLKEALIKQAEKYEHVISANTCQENLVKLSEKLSLLCKGLNRVFFASEGSSAVEVALKMSLHARLIKNRNQENKSHSKSSKRKKKNKIHKNKTKVLCLKHAYHGETLFALSLSDMPLYKKPYTSWLLPSYILRNIPYVTSIEDPLWKNCSSLWPLIENELTKFADSLCTIIVEPIVQGAAGMLMYSADFLRRMREWAEQNDVFFICDEIMTGLGRTGTSLAANYAEVKPDFICLGKGLTAGWLPMSAVITSNEIYSLFYDDYHNDKSFLHSHTFSGNILAASVALETLNIIEEEQIYHQVQAKQILLRNLMCEVASQTGKLQNIRGIGAIIAADLIVEPELLVRYARYGSRIGFEVFKKAMKLGALLRPLGNTIYWLPPLNIEIKTLYELKEITTQAIMEVYR